jgi:hypothetical protein
MAAGRTGKPRYSKRDVNVVNPNPLPYRPAVRTIGGHLGNVPLDLP